MDAAPFGYMRQLPNALTIDLDAADTAHNARIGTALLEALEGKGKATFFLPARAAKSAAEIVAAGHEVGVITSRNPSRSRPYCPDFQRELADTKHLVEDAAGTRIRGHRNASLGIVEETEWVYDVLLDAGFEHDSSRVPPRDDQVVRGPVPRSLHTLRRWNGMLLEIPVTTADLPIGRVPFATTAMVRTMPMAGWSLLARNRGSRGEPLVAHVRASELTLHATFGRGPARVDTRAVRRVGDLAKRLQLTSIASAYSEYLLAAPILDS
jgi:peptidoglycan/xylan/chitin deacetylase (PgdA/CDA1 family)